MNINEVYLKGQEEATGSNNPNKIIIHHPEWYGDIVGLNNIMRNMGYSMIGYNYYVRKDGSVWKGRPDWATGANCYGQNTQSLGVCFEGNFEKDAEMPKEQFNSGVELIQYLKNKYGISEVGGHKQYYNTSCPGKNFPLTDLINSVNGSAPIENSSTIDDLLYGITTANVLNVRDGASTSSTIIGTLSKDTDVKINTRYSKNSWYSIYYGNNGGFIHKNYVSIVGQESQSSDVVIEENPIMYGTIKVNSVLNVRDGASTNSTIIGQLSNGEKVKIDKRYSTDTFYSIYYGNSGGFIHKDYVRLD